MKPFKGVIRHWHRDGDVIVGKCGYHKDAVPMSMDAVVHNQIVVGHEMHTSKIENLEDHGFGVVMCETKNSVYALVDPAP